MKIRTKKMNFKKKDAQKKWLMQQIMAGRHENLFEQNTA